MGGGGALAPPQIFAIVDLLPIDNDSKKKKNIVKTYKPFSNSSSATGKTDLVYCI